VTIFNATEPVDMRELPEIAASLTPFIPDFETPYLVVEDYGGFSLIFADDDVSAGPPTAVVVMKPDGVAYEFRDLDYPDNVGPLDSLEELLAIVLGGADQVNGSEEADYLTGLGGKDVIEGRGGNDFVSGGADKDKLWGNDGRDTFVFDILPNSNKLADVVKDFTNKDAIGLSGSVFTALGPKVNKKEFVVGKKAKDKNDHLLYDDKKGALYYDENGKLDGGKVKIAKFAGQPDLDHKDFDILV